MKCKWELDETAWRPIREAFAVHFPKLNGAKRRSCVFQSAILDTKFVEVHELAIRALPSVNARLALNAIASPNRSRLP